MMRICMIVEGSYPYVRGGVSNWVQELIEEMSEFEFVIFSIGAQEKMKGNYKYSLPKNVVEVRETFLDVYLKEDAVWGKRYYFSDVEKQTLLSLISGRETNWSAFFSLMNDKRLPPVLEFLGSKDYFDIVKQISVDLYSHIPFTEVFWTIRSIILPLFEVFRVGLPEADLYHSVSTGYGGLLGACGKALYNKPFLLTEHGIYSREREEELIKANWIKGYLKDIWIRYFYNLCNSSYRYADRAIALFEGNKQIQIELGCRQEIIDVIPNGVDPARFSHIASKEQGDDTIYIGSFARVVPIKDIKTMIQSFSIVEQEIANVHFYIMGPTDEDEGYFEECVQLANMLDIKNLHFTGLIHIDEYIGKMDILVLTSISEGQPLAMLEGMSCGKPYVTTDVGCCRELIEGNDDGWGPAGFVASVMNYERVAQYLIQLCHDKEMRVQMGENGKRRIAQAYTKERFIAGYRSIYSRFREENGNGGNWF